MFDKLRATHWSVYVYYCSLSLSVFFAIFSIWFFWTRQSSGHNGIDQLMILSPVYMIIAWNTAQVTKPIKIHESLSYQDAKNAFIQEAYDKHIAFKKWREDMKWNSVLMSLMIFIALFVEF